jgi:hypothetical protein
MLGILGSSIPLRLGRLRVRSLGSVLYGVFMAGVYGLRSVCKVDVWCDVVLGLVVLHLNLK